jgi:hypothetical protein
MKGPSMVKMLVLTPFELATYTGYEYTQSRGRPARPRTRTTDVCDSVSVLETCWERRAPRL